MHDSGSSAVSARLMVSWLIVLMWHSHMHTGICYSLTQISLLSTVGFQSHSVFLPCWMIVDQIAHTRSKLFWVYYFHSFWDFFSGLSIGMSIKRVLVTAFNGEVHLTLEDFKSCHRVYALSVPAIRQLFSPYFLFSLISHLSSLCLVHSSLRFSKRYNPFPPSHPLECHWLSQTTLRAS